MNYRTSGFIVYSKYRRKPKSYHIRYVSRRRLRFTSPLPQEHTHRKSKELLWVIYTTSQTGPVSFETLVSAPPCYSTVAANNGPLRAALRTRASSPSRTGTSQPVPPAKGTQRAAGGNKTTANRLSKARQHPKPQSSTVVAVPDAAIRHAHDTRQLSGGQKNFPPTLSLVAPTLFDVVYSITPATQNEAAGVVSGARPAGDHAVSASFAYVRRGNCYARTFFFTASNLLRVSIVSWSCSPSLAVRIVRACSNSGTDSEYFSCEWLRCGLRKIFF